MDKSEEHIWYDEKQKKWVVGHDIVVYLPLDDSGLLKRFEIPKGFASDLGSIPRMWWWLIAPHEIGVFDAIVHDYLYRHQIDCRQWADWVLLYSMRQNNKPFWMRKLVYGLLRSWGWIAWNKHAKAKRLALSPK